MPTNQPNKSDGEHEEGPPTRPDDRGAADRQEQTKPDETDGPSDKSGGQPDYGGN